MPRQRSAGAAARRAAPLALAALLAAGCASAAKTTTSATTSPGSPAATASSGSGGMTGMDMGGGTGGASPAGAIKPVPTQQLGAADWQGMRITAKAMTAVPFVVYNGTGEQTVRPGPKASFHLMVMLSDAQTGTAIPYASVWATIRKNGKIIFDERQWPMISRYMGPHYGNDVSLPGAGTYRLSLLVSPPVSARHLEYQHVWLKPHRVDFTFHWAPSS